MCVRDITPQCHLESPSPAQAEIKAVGVLLLKAEKPAAKMEAQIKQVQEAAPWATQPTGKFTAET